MPGVARVIRGADVPRNLNTLLSLLDFGIDDEPLLADDEGRATRASRSPPSSPRPSARRSRRWRRSGSTGRRCRPSSTSRRRSSPARRWSTRPTRRTLFVYHGNYDHQKLRFGDVERAFAEADHVVEGRYQMSPIEQAPTETCGAIAAPETNDRFVVYTSTQALFFSLDTCAKLLTMPSNRLHFIGGTVGGGFGGKVDSLHEPLAILGAMLTGRPVQVTCSDREEEMQVGAPRGAERWYLKDGVMRDGRITRAQVHRLLRQRRLHPALDLRDHQVRRPPARPLHDPERPRRRLLRLHQPHAGDGDARLRHHRRRLRDRVPHGQARPRSSASTRSSSASSTPTATAT